MSYPTNSGISGQVFKSQKLYFSNNASKESKFVEEIDDQSLSGYPVKNFMIGPVFGANDSTTPCAIIQFINKVESGHGDSAVLCDVGEADVAKFHSMQKLLGMCIDNTNEMSHTIKMSFDVQDIMLRIND